MHLFTFHSLIFIHMNHFGPQFSQLLDENDDLSSHYLARKLQIKRDNVLKAPIKLQNSKKKGGHHGEQGFQTHRHMLTLLYLQN